MSKPGAYLRPRSLHSERSDHLQLATAAGYPGPYPAVYPETNLATTRVPAAVYPETNLAVYPETNLAGPPGPYPATTRFCAAGHPGPYPATNRL